jgi:hypothetical protein
MVIRAEQAFLGAVMADPRRQAELLDLVRPADMRRPCHGQVLAAMQRLRARGADPGPVVVRAELTADPDLPPPVALDGVLLADLLEAAPRSGHAPAYAAMVIERGIRQRLELAGSRMIQVAEAGQLEPALLVTAQALRDAGECRARWDTLPEPMRQEVPQQTGRRTGQAEEAAWQLRTASEEIARTRQDTQVGLPDDLGTRLESIARHVALAAAASRPTGRDRLHAPGETRPQDPAAGPAGERFLRDLAAGPGQVAAVRDWLDPGHFARPAHGHLYALIRDMHAVGKPIDPVTISWEAERRGIAIDAAELDGGMTTGALAGAREVRRHGLLARITDAGRAVSAAASDAQVPTAAMLRATESRLRSLEQELAARPGRPGRHGAADRRAASRSARPARSPDGRQSHQGAVTAEPA